MAKMRKTVTNAKSNVSAPPPIAPPNALANKQPPPLIGSSKPK